jgi:hypothetical protein
MKIEIGISDAIQEMFGKHLGNYNSPKNIKKLIEHYLNSHIERDDLEPFLTQYVDQLDNSGELDEIINGDNGDIYEWWKKNTSI